LLKAEGGGVPRGCSHATQGKEKQVKLCGKERDGNLKHLDKRQQKRGPRRGTTEGGEGKKGGI